MMHMYTSVAAAGVQGLTRRPPATYRALLSGLRAV